MKKTLLSFITAALLSTAVHGEDKVYVKVNGESITNSDVAVLLKNPRLNFQDLSTVQQQNVLESLVEQKLLSQEAMKSDLIKSQEYKTELEKLKQTLAYNLWMRDIGKTIDASQKEIKEFYTKNKAQYKTPLQLKASHILLKTEKEAQDVIKALQSEKNTKEVFTKLAKEKSIGPSGPSGGELGWFTQEKMVAPFSQAAQKLSVKTFTKQPVQTQYGYHVIFLDDKKEPQTIPFEKISNNIKQQVLQQKFIETIRNKAQALKQKAKIEYIK